MSELYLHGVEVLEIDSGPRPIQTIRTSVIGLCGTAPDADADAFPLNTPVMVAGNRTAAALLDTVGDGNGTLPNAIDAIFDQAGAVVVVVRVDEGVDDAATMVNAVGGIDADGQFTGVHAFRGAASAVGFTPRILIAPGFTHQREEDADNPGTYLKNPVVAELEGIADQLRAVCIVDGPNLTDEKAIEAVGDFGSARVFFHDPWFKVYRNGVFVAEPPSARIAGIIARMDNDRGFWWSPSNQLVNGISGLTRPVDFAMGDYNCRANLLNEQNIATTINYDGYRLWGNRTPSSDAKWTFLPVRRTADMINESILKAHLWAVDRPITRTYAEDVSAGVNAYLRTLRAKGAILGGECWPNTELNTADAIALGKVYFDFDFTPTYPAERVTFRSLLVNDYIEEVFG